MNELEQIIFNNIRGWTQKGILDWMVEAQAKEIAKAIQDSQWLDDERTIAFNKGVGF